ncbi:zinc finger MYM-type protein 1-like [Panulirus ornatus]|uniref:zinc finger MYM-type protein 1-like n=1 Tax=Panulirus ornatus TaxID=150431 RepID=UPI003A893817
MGNSVEEILNSPFSSRTYESKLKVVEEGKPCPALPNLLSKHKDKKSEYMRHFSISQYETVEWMTGCEKRSRLFCWPCLLFSKENGVWNKHGFSDLNHLTTAQQKHERSQHHVQSFFNLKMFGKQRNDTLIDSQQKNEVSRHNEQVRKNREIMKRIIDVICYITKQEFPLQGYDESGNSANKGNCIELLNLLREYDPLLDSHLNTSTVFQEVSQTVQNDLIKAISKVVRDYIKREINSATFVAIILEETSDVMSKSQISTVLRFVHEGKIQERFIGCTDVSADRTSEGLFSHVVNTVQEFQLGGKLVGQTYDGASVMSGHMNGLQSKVLNAYPLALFTPCYAHLLNVVLQQGLSDIRECRIFFQILSGLPAYFSKSYKRLHALHELINRKLPSVTPTRWNFTSCLCNTVHKYRIQFIEFFEHIIENSENWDTDAIVQARGFLDFLKDFPTVLLLEIFSKLFGYTDVLTSSLRNKTYDVLYCCEKINDVTQQLQHNKEHGFEDLWVSALSDRNDTEQKPKRLKCTVDDDEKTAYLQLYYKIVDSICMQIDCRYSSLSTLEFFHLLWHEKYEEYIEKFPDSLVNKLKDFYGSLFDYIRLKNELTVLYSCSEFSNKHVHELVEFMNENNLRCGFKEVFKLAELILTIPSNTAAAEPSFSALKRMNSYFRDTEEQEAMSGPSLLSVERKLLMELRQRGSFYDDVIAQFTSQERRLELIYK